MYNVGIVGYTGMVGQELERILSQDGNSKVNIAYRRNSSSTEGRISDCDIVFLATKDKESLKYVREVIQSQSRVIDMSGAFRLTYEEFEKWYNIEHTERELLNTAVYGMPAINKNKIETARIVANPGCYATSVILSLNPIKELIKGEATVVSTSGNSGARKTIEEISDDVTYSFGYKHKHVPEMARYSGVKVNFAPVVLRSVFRGINTNIRVQLNDELTHVSDNEVREVIESTIKKVYVYEDLVFVVRDSDTCQYGTNNVNNTNRMNIKVNVQDGFAYINSCIDNLGKGAASQAIENMNIMLGLPRFYGIAPAYKCE